VNPFEAVSGKLLANFTAIESDKNAKAYCDDPVQRPHGLTCQSATELSAYSDSTIDLVIADPPFGGLLHYAEILSLPRAYIERVRLPVEAREDLTRRCCVWRNRPWRIGAYPIIEPVLMGMLTGLTGKSIENTF
jgi:hypothetical protein